MFGHADENAFGGSAEWGAHPFGGGPGAPSPEEGASPRLGEDNADIIARAKEALRARLLGQKGSGEPAAPAPRAAEVSQVQVSLDDEANVRELEDPGLLAHMDQARADLAAYELRSAQLPSMESLNASNVAAQRALSALTVALKEQQMALQCAWDNVLLQASNVEHLLAGRLPHGFPPEGSLVGGIKFLGKRLQGTGGELGLVVAALEDFERGLALARRAHETTAAGLLQRCAHFEAGPPPQN